MLKLPTLSKLPKYKRFEIVTRFYNPEKEDLQSRVRMAEIRLDEAEKAKTEDNPLARQDRMKYALRQQRKHQKQGIKEMFSPVFLIRFAIMLVVTVGLGSFLLYGEEIMTFLDRNWAFYLAVILGLFIVSKVLKR